MTIADTVMKLRAMQQAAIKKQHEVQLAAARARRAVAEMQLAAEDFNEALHAAYIAHCVPPGHGFDLWGDKTVKPADQCAMAPAPPCDEVKV